MPSPLLEMPSGLAGTPLASTRAPAWARRAVTLLAILGVAAIFGTAGSTPADPRLLSSAASRIEGFDQARLSVLDASPASGVSPGVRCALLAQTAEQHSRGLMTRRDLAGYPAMVFVFDADANLVFYNRNVPIALSVAWFDADGRWLGAKDLDPCPDMDGCPTIAAPSPYRYAVEVPKGGLSGLGLGPASRIAVTPDC